MELAEAMQKIGTLEEQLSKATEKANNFDAYRKTHSIEDRVHEETVAERDTLKTEHETLKGNVEKETTERRTKYMENKIKDMSKGDPKVAAAIKAEYDILNLPDDTEENIGARFEKARSIAMWSNEKLDINAAGGGSPAINNNNGPEKQMTPEAQSLLGSMRTFAQQNGERPAPTAAQ